MPRSFGDFGVSTSEFHLALLEICQAGPLTKAISKYAYDGNLEDFENTLDAMSDKELGVSSNAPTAEP